MIIFTRQEPIRCQGCLCGPTSETDRSSERHHLVLADRRASKPEDGRTETWHAAAPRTSDKRHSPRLFHVAEREATSASTCADICLTGSEANKV